MIKIIMIQKIMIYHDTKNHDTRYDDMIHSYPIITSKHFRNDSFRNEFTKILAETVINRLSCAVDYYVSRIETSYGSSIGINVYWPRDSHVYIQHVPSQDPIDFLLYLCSSFGIWLGVSILSISHGLIHLIVNLFKAKDDHGLNGQNLNGQNLLDQDVRIQLLNMRRKLAAQSRLIQIIMSQNRRNRFSRLINDKIDTTLIN